MTEIQKTLDIQAIANAYGYTPPPDTSEKVDLGLEWNECTEHAEAFTNNYDDLVIDSPHPERDYDDNGIKKKKFLLHREVFQGTNPAVELLSFKNFIQGKNESLSFELERNGEIISQLYFKQDTDHEWDLNHRFIHPPFRRQGIVSEMMKRAEDTLQARANSTNQEQVINVSVAQLPVLNLFLKNGYEVVPEDINAFLKIQNADPALNIVSCPEEDTNQEKIWYIVDRTKYEAMGEREFWELDVPTHKRKRLDTTESYIIRLRKTLKPDEAKVESIRNTFREQVAKTRVNHR